MNKTHPCFLSPVAGPRCRLGPPHIAGPGGQRTTGPARFALPARAAAPVRPRAAAPSKTVPSRVPLPALSLDSALSLTKHRAALREILFAQRARLRAELAHAAPGRAKDLRYGQDINQQCLRMLDGPAVDSPAGRAAFAARLNSARGGLELVDRLLRGPL